MGLMLNMPSPTQPYVAQVPTRIDPLDAAVLTCAGVTTYKAVKMSGARPGQLMAVFGIGGLGHLALQYGKISGATVVAVDVVDDKLELAKELGADYVVNALTEDPAGGDSGPRWRTRGHLGGCRTKGVRAGVRRSTPRRHSGLRRAAG